MKNLPISISEDIRLRFLRDDEKSFVSQEKELPLVIEPVEEKSFAVLQLLLSKNRDWFNHQLDTYGAILFRGFDIENAEQFQTILELHNIQLESVYHFGSAHRLRITDKVFTSSEAPPDTIIAPHNELNMVPIRPYVLAFFCQIEPDLYGETPIINTEKIFSHLSPSLQHKITTSPQRFVRYVPNHLLDLVFQGLSPEDITKLLQEQGFDFTWEDDGSLYFDCSYITLFSHPRTNKLCFCLSIVDALISRQWYRHISQRYSFWQRLYYNWLPAKLYKGFQQKLTTAATVVDSSQKKTSSLNTYFLSTDGQSTTLTEAEAKELGEAEWKNAVIFQWKQGDILLIDNLQVAHSRLNTKLKRKILTAFGNMCNIRDMKPA
ncbi:MAG: TauD/TfdA family dioxygenase [Nostoc sp. NMS7]|uniref:TauD/TfdA family dioxygenase n=1 Tax=Nostoc sp. NMS7 TaxID=2815391 RepID=UPI0025F58619|nr:TauD/TfdA family dioxygenase [Nostoc sp. NMS7]MBN3947421.1 TauD/TfdA family dioxygenase [Nostoc sp. NMS7]